MTNLLSKYVKAAVVGLLIVLIIGNGTLTYAQQRQKLTTQTAGNPIQLYRFLTSPEWGYGDHQWQGASNYDLLWDASVYTLHLPDNTELGFGNTATTPDIWMRWDGTNFDILTTLTDESAAVNLGVDTAGVDFNLFGATASDGLFWDASLDKLTVTHDLTLFTCAEAAGDQFKVDATGTVAGNAINLETTNGGVLINADGSTNGDIGINSEDDITITAADDFSLAQGDGDNSDASPTSDGRRLSQILRCTYDFAVNGGAEGTISLTQTLPDNAVVTRGYLEVVTTFTSSGDNATVSLDIVSDDVAGLVAAVAIDAGGNPWDTGFHECIQDGAAANFSTKTTAARAIQITVAGGEALTAGKMVIWLEFVVSD